MLECILSMMLTMYHPRSQPVQPPAYRYGEVTLADIERIAFDMTNSCPSRPKQCNFSLTKAGFAVTITGVDRVGGMVQFEMEFVDSTGYSEFSDELPKWLYYWELIIGGEWS